MDNSGISPAAVAQDGGNAVDVKLGTLLAILRKHLDMDVAFISEFINGERVFRFVDADNDKAPIAPGQSDPLADTYCKRIVDGTLDNIIADTQKNPVTKSLEVTQRLSIGAYMGVPITLSNGEVYGTFCCYKIARGDAISPGDLSFLNAISEITSHLIEDLIYADNARHELTKRVSAVLHEDKINIHYQPIYDLASNRVIGFESLSRFVTEHYRTPDIWFNEAAQIGLGEELEMMAIGNAIKGLEQLSEDSYISINVSPQYVTSGAIARALKDVDCERIVLEITEHSPVDCYTTLRQALIPLRKRGLRIAIDDAGAGYASFQHILELEADFIKLDISLTQHINAQPRKYLLAKSLCAFARSIDCIIIAEGVETAQELASLKEMGVDKAQGYYLGRPAPIEQAASHLATTL